MYADGEVTVPLRAEVGLLTRNIKIRGNKNPQWNEVIEACPEGFNTGILLNIKYMSNFQIKNNYRMNNF